MADQLCESRRRSEEREEVTLRNALVVAVAGHRYRLFASSRAFSRSNSADAPHFFIPRSFPVARAHKRHRTARALVDFHRCAANNCENAFPKFSREPGDASRRFSLECLPIQASFACNHQIGIHSFSIQDQLPPRRLRSPAEFSRRKNSSGRIRVRLPRLRPVRRDNQHRILLKQRQRVWRAHAPSISILSAVAPFLRTEDSGRAIFAEQWISDIDCRDNLWQRQIPRPLNLLQLLQLTHSACAILACPR